MTSNNPRFMLDIFQCTMNDMFFCPIKVIIYNVFIGFFLLLINR